MNWSGLLGIAGGALILMLALLRVERKRLWVVVVFLVLPTLYLLLQWIRFRGMWIEALLGLAAATLITAAWWYAYGRNLPAPTSDNIKVWGAESTPRPKPAELQAELQRLREEKERLEAELNRLKAGRNGQEDGK